MGLDNGIIIKNKNGIEKEEEICYWRKCWNIRNKIFEIIGKHLDDEEYEYSLSLDDLVDICYALKTLNKENWSENGGSIWEWEEIRKGLKRDIKTLNKLIKRMKREPDLEVIFYDSY